MSYGETFGGGGGRVLPGVGGAGGTILGSPDGDSFGGDGGSAGDNGFLGVNAAGGGGGWGANGGVGRADGDNIGNPGLGGKAVDLNGHTVTWEGEFDTDFSNHIYGAVS